MNEECWAKSCSKYEISGQGKRDKSMKTSDEAVRGNLAQDRVGQINAIR